MAVGVEEVDLDVASGKESTTGGLACHTGSVRGEGLATETETTITLMVTMAVLIGTDRTPPGQDTAERGKETAITTARTVTGVDMTEDTVEEAMTGATTEATIADTTAITAGDMTEVHGTITPEETTTEGRMKETSTGTDRLIEALEELQREHRPKAPSRLCGLSS